MQSHRTPALHAGRAQPGADLVQQNPTTIDRFHHRHHDRHSCDTCRALDQLPPTVLADQNRLINADVFVSIFESALDRCGITNAAGDQDFAPCFIVRLFWPLAQHCQRVRRLRSANYEQIKRVAIASWPQIKRDDEKAEELRAAVSYQIVRPSFTAREVHEQNCPACRILQPLEAAGAPFWQGNQCVADFSTQWLTWLTRSMFPLPLEESGECFFYRLLTPIQLMLQRGRGIDPWSTPYWDLLRAAIQVEQQSRGCNWDALEPYTNRSGDPDAAMEYVQPNDCTLLDLRHGYFVDITRNGMSLAVQYKSTLPIGSMPRLWHIVDLWLDRVPNMSLPDAAALTQLSADEGE